MASATFSVLASSDDCSVYWTGSAWTIEPLTATRLDVGYGSSTWLKIGSGIRFQNITIPQGATIITAHLILVASVELTDTTVNSRITGEDVDDAATWSTLADYQTRRGIVVGGANDNYITDAQVDWNNIPAWTASESYNSPEIKTVIQEIVNRVGWASGQALALWLDDHDDGSTHFINRYRRAASYDHLTLDPPALYVEWTPPAVGWTGKISGVTNPAKIMGVDVANIAKVKGVASA